MKPFLQNVLNRRRLLTGAAFAVLLILLIIVNAEFFGGQDGADGTAGNGAGTEEETEKYEGIEIGTEEAGKYFGFDGLLYLSHLSSSTFDYAESRMEGANFIIGGDRFEIDYTGQEDYEITQPVYVRKKMAGDMIMAFEKSTMNTVSVSEYKGKHRFDIFTEENQKTNFCLYAMDKQLWLASYANNTADGSEITMYIWKLKPLHYEQLAQDILNTMTAEEKAGQMFFVRCRKDSAIDDLEKYFFGGYILFGADIEGQTKETLKSTIQSYQYASKIGLLIGVDEEGGDVVRVSKYPEFRAAPFRSPQSLYTEGGFKLIAEDTKEKSELLKSLGFNVNLAPVCDVSTEPADYIYKRTFGKGAEETADYVKTAVEAMNDSRIGCVLKHFPGYGGNADTHKGIAVDDRSYDSFVTSDFIPFQAGIDAGAGSVLVSHNIVKCMDESVPASLSPAVYKILRDTLDFDGVAMTDDLDMDAVRDYIGDEASAVLAVKAGCDLIISSGFDIQIPSLLAAIERGEITKDRIDESVRRILEWKLRLGIIPTE